MKKEEINLLCESYIVEPFYKNLSESIARTSPQSLLSRKNPYLVALRDNQSPNVLAKSLLDAYVSSSEETILGNLLEKLAIAINSKIYGGYKAEEGKYVGIDLIFIKNGIKYMLSIKSGTNWGNSDQKNAMKRNFAAARTLVKQEGWEGNIKFINGCIYGKSAKSEKIDSNFPDSNYHLLAGKDFWNFISGQEDIGRIILEAIGESTKRYFKVNGLSYEEQYKSKLAEIEKYIIALTKDSDNSLDPKELSQAMLGNI